MTAMPPVNTGDAHRAILKGDKSAGIKVRLDPFARNLGHQ